MKKRFIVLATLLITGFLPVTKTSAQTATSSYTLQQCLDYALKNYNDIKNAELDIQSAAAKVGEVRGSGLPQVTAGASLIDNPQLPRLFLPGDRAAGFDPANPSLYADRSKVYALPNLFQLRSSGDMNIGLNQLLFDGSYIMGLKASKVYKELASKSLIQTKIQVVENVTKAFYMVLINQEQLQLLDANVSRLDSLFNNTKALQKEGFMEAIDVNRIEVARNNLLAERTKFTQLTGVTNLLLKYQMGMPLNDSLALQGSIRDLQIDAVDTKVEAKPENRIEYSLLKTRSELNALDVKSNQSKFFPSLYGFAKGGYSRSDLNLGEVLRNHWYSYSMYGVSLSVPIISGGTRIYKLKQSNYEYKKSENNLAQFRQSVDLQVKQSVINLDNELKTLEIQKRNLDLATEVVRVSKIKYTNGSGSNLEVTDAENSFKQAQTNYFHAVYSVLLAKIDYQKSTGTLYTE
jgi:outer membrane protein